MSSSRLAGSVVRRSRVVATLVLAAGPLAATRGIDGPAQIGSAFVPTAIAPGLPPGRGLVESVAELERRTGFSVRVEGQGGGGPALSAGLKAGGDAGGTFWEVLDRLARGSGMEVAPRLAVEGRQLVLSRATGRPAQATISGTYRCSLIRLVEARSISYGGDVARPPALALTEPARMAGKGLPPARSDSFALLSLLAEPRPLIDVQLAGPPRVDQAVDDLGRSTVVPPAKLPYPGRFIQYRWLFGLDLRVPLDIRRPPARSIRRLEGVIPVVTWIEHPTPIDVDLADPPGRPIRGAGVILKVVPRPSTARADAIVVEMSPDDPDLAPGVVVPLFEAGPGRMFADRGLQFELRAADGSRIAADVQTAGIAPPGTFRVTLTPGGRPKPGAPAQVAPARLRYRGLAWSRDEVPFRFEEVPLP